MQKIKLMGLLTIIISLLLGMFAVPAMAKTYSSMDDMITAISNGTAVKYTDIVSFGTYNSNTLKWIYMGENQDISETSALNEPYFVMTKDSFQTMDLSKTYDSGNNIYYWTDSNLYVWLNGTFKATNLNDSRILEVTLPSLDDYDSRIKNISGEGSYSKNWWLRTRYSHSNAYYVISSGIGITNNSMSKSYGVRPAFYLKADSITSSGGSSGVSQADIDKLKNNTSYNGQSSAYWAYQASQAAQNPVSPPLFTVFKNKPFEVVVLGNNLGTASAPIAGTTVAKIKGVDTTLTVVQASIGDGYITLSNAPSYNSGKGFSGTGVKVVTVTNGTQTQKFYFTVIDAPVPTLSWN